MSKKRSICYVVPYFSETDDQHFAHLPRFLTEVAQLCDLYVIVERGTAPEIPGARRVIAQAVDPRRRIRRYLEFLSIVRGFRKEGCRRFFVRISVGAGLMLLLASPFLGTELYYWNSGDVETALRSNPSPNRRRSGKDRIKRFVIRRSRKLVTGPESMVDYYVAEYGISRRHCIVLYNDVDLTAFHPLPSEDVAEARRRLGMEAGIVYVLFAGRLSFLKGGDLLPQIAERLASATQLRIIAVGRVESHELERQLAASRIVDAIGRRPNRDVLSYMQVSDILILPSRAEGFPRTVLEAMACGLPVASFSVGGVSQILGPSQQRSVVRPGDLDRFASAVLELASDQDLRRSLGDENLREVQRFSTQRVARMFVERIVPAPSG